MKQRVLAGLLAAPLVLAGCEAGTTEQAAIPQAPVAVGGQEPEPVTATTTTTTPPVAVTQPPATAPAPAPVEGLARGMEGEAVKALQDRLVALKYDPGTADGRYGGGTAVAVMAFQKVTGLARTGNATPDVLAALESAADPAPMLPDGGPTRVEVDFARQVLFFWRDGALVRILPVSTGNGKKYCATSGGVKKCGVAVTPSGSYRIERRIKGTRKSHLGVLYNPLYFKGGYAIHGSPSVPAKPASHGCVRIPIHSSVWFLDNVANGTPVYLIGGKYPAVPFPPEPPPPPAEPGSTDPAPDPGTPITEDPGPTPT